MDFSRRNSKFPPRNDLTYEQQSQRAMPNSGKMIKAHQLMKSIMKDCNQCGKCCIKYGDGDLAATQEEIDLWELFNPDIFEYVRGSEIWFDPESGERLTRCPFLELVPTKDTKAQAKYTCSIYLDRPEDCRHYPSLINEMVRDECEMIEVVDLQDTKKAQRKLDLLMKDSRPSSYS